MENSLANSPADEIVVVVVVVVLYGTRMEESVTLQSLVNQGAISRQARLVIWDNSARSGRDDDLLAELNSLYASAEFSHSPENTGLSVVYNSLVKRCGSGLYVFLDQDSGLSASYLRSVADAASGHRDLGLFVPQVEADGVLVSPAGFGHCTGKLLTGIDEGINSTESRTIITSGIAVRASVFEDAGLWFNERLWLYSIDTDFFLRFRDVFPTFYVLGEKIVHGSALRSTLSLEQRLFRFKNLRWSYLQMFRGRGTSMLMPLAYMAWSSVKRAIQYKCPRFLSGWSDSGR